MSQSQDIPPFAPKLTLVVGVCLAVCWLLGVPVRLLYWSALFLFPLLMSLHFAGKRRYAILGTGAVVFLVALLVVFGSDIWAPNKHHTARRTQCGSNLKKLAAALNAYEAQHGSFPPAYIKGPDGKPWHSWRVLILPQLGEQKLYEQYSFDEPWDGPNNRRLTAKMPDVFRCPVDVKRPEWNTSYVAVVGSETIWPGPEGCRLKQVKDGLSNTLLLAETVDSGIGWMQPVDLNVGEIFYRIGAPEGVCSNHPGGANVVAADGELHFLPATLPVSNVKTLLTRHGREEVEFPWGNE